MKKKNHTSISFSVNPKHLRSGCSPARLNEQFFHRPAKPMSSSISLSTAVDDSRELANRGFDVSDCSSACAASSVADDWQCSRMSSRSEMMGAHLLDSTVSKG